MLFRRLAMAGDENNEDRRRRQRQYWRSTFDQTDVTQRIAPDLAPGHELPV
jgi:hypothetical protein